jgi:predicted nucleic acid-binding protein
MTARVYVAEPPAAYRVRPSLVVDCSALAVVLFREPGADQVAARLAGHRLHAPHLLQAELANVALVKHRRGEPHALAALAHAATLDIDFYRLDMTACAMLAAQYDLTAYDAAYLCLASELECPLITLDRKLGEAAQRYFEAGRPG